MVIFDYFYVDTPMRCILSIYVIIYIHLHIIKWCEGITNKQLQRGARWSRGLISAPRSGGPCSNPGASNKLYLLNFLSHSLSPCIHNLLLSEGKICDQLKSDKNDGIMDLHNGRKEENVHL